MSIEIKVPQLPESVQDATLVSWHKKAGDAVNRDENLVDIETDKVVLEVPGARVGRAERDPRQGRHHRRCGPGDRHPGRRRRRCCSSCDQEPKPSPLPHPLRLHSSLQPQPRASRRPATADMPLSPSVRRLVEENKLDPSQIKGSARDGRLTKGDVLDYMANRGSQPAAGSQATAAAPVARVVVPAPAKIGACP